MILKEKKYIWNFLKISSFEAHNLFGKIEKHFFGNLFFFDPKHYKKKIKKVVPFDGEGLQIVN